MKQFTIAFLALTVFFFASSCKKDNVDPVEPSGGSTGIAGDWVGKYDYLDNSQEYFYSFRITDKGVIEEIQYNGDVVGKGTWTLNGSQFTATYQSTGAAGIVYSVTATYNKAEKSLTGKWGKKNSPISGSWYMHKN